MPKRSTKARLEAARLRLNRERNIWLATASRSGRAHLIPLSLAWIDGAVVVATPTDSVTVRNVAETGQARASLDDADDVVILDLDVVVHDYETADPALLTAFVNRIGWDPKSTPGRWSLLVMTPQRIQSWIGPDEIQGRTIMRDGRWLEEH